MTHAQKKNFAAQLHELTARYYHPWSFSRRTHAWKITFCAGINTLSASNGRCGTADQLLHRVEYSGG